MTILILGATSTLGRAFAREFAANNVLLLSGRDPERLTLVKEEALCAGASETIIIQKTLEEDPESFFSAAHISRIDLIINAASSVSRLRDSAIDPEKVSLYTKVDLLNPIKILLLELKKRRCDQEANSPLHLIYVSSTLARIHSPNRDIYSHYKGLQEAFLTRIAEHDAKLFHVAIVDIGTLLRRDRMTAKHLKLVRKVSRYYQKKSIIHYGIFGRMMTAAYSVSPFAVKGLIYTTRFMRSIISGKGETERSKLNKT